MALTFNRGTGTGQVEVDPISRIEGHLGVKLTVDAGTVTGADVHGNLWRGFENFLIGREVNDAITFVQRICGVCPVPHGQTSTFAVDAVLGYNENFATFVAGGQYSPTGSAGAVDDRVPVPAGKGIPLKAVVIRNLVLSAEFLMSHITHSYHLAAPSYIQGPNIPPWTPYYHNDFYHPLMTSTGNGVVATSNASNVDAGHSGATLPVLEEGFSKDLWSAVIRSYVHALRIRRLTFEAGALFAGRMPMTSCFVGGGVTTDKDEDLTVKCTKFRTIMEEIGGFIVKEFVPIFLALGALYPNYDNPYNAQWLSDNAPALWDLGNKAAAGPYAAGKAGWGAGAGNFLAWGGFPQTDGYLGFARGYMIGAGSATQSITAADVLANLREHIAHSRYQGSTETVDANGNPVVTPADVTDPATEARTVPDRDGGEVKYSWLKAPRWNDQPMEVGPMARMFVGRFFQDNVALATSIPLYGAYTKSVAMAGAQGSVSGLDPAMIAPDVAVACVRAGIATLTVVDTAGEPASNTVVGQAEIATLDQAAIAGAYGNANAVITGPLALWVVNLKAGASTIDRLRARPLEALVLITKMIGGFTKGANGLAELSWTGGGWLGELQATNPGEPTYIVKTAPAGEVFGFGGTEAPRGALMHMCTQVNGRIKKYQCIVPTTWNASPKDAADVAGPMEQAMLGIPYNTQETGIKGGAGADVVTGGGVEALRVAQSFDPCIACAVH